MNSVGVCYVVMFHVLICVALSLWSCLDSEIYAHKPHTFLPAPPPGIPQHGAEAAAAAPGVGTAAGGGGWHAGPPGHAAGH